MIRTLRDLDRRLPFGTATVVAASMASVLVAGTATAFVKDGDTTSKPKAAATPSAKPSAKATPSAKPSPTRTGPKTPEDYLLDVETVLPGWDRISDRIAAAGVMDLEDAAEIEAGGEKPTQEDRDALTQLGFVRGHSRAWTDGDATLVVFVYEWKDTTGPLTFLRGLEVINGESGTGWKPGIQHSAGACRPQGKQVNDSVVAAVGKRSFLVVTLRAGSCSTHEPVVKIADLQVRHARTLGA